jgi:DNA-binding MarR family transcriptional regulator
VKRNICAENRRKVEIFITEVGLETLKTLDPITEAHNESIVASLNQNELEQLNHLLNNLRT